jgi:hypothetical protein
LLGRLLAAWLVVLAALAMPLTASAGHGASNPDDSAIRLAAPPDETCGPDATGLRGGGFNVCAPPAAGDPGSGGLSVGGLLPILLALVVGAAGALVIAYLVLRRRAGPPLDPVDAGEWWTCRNCGSNNVVGSPRCYSCGQWQR